MALTLYVDGARWRAHLRETCSTSPGLVPVAKGNGYGFGLGRLARRAQWLGVDTLAVGTYEELPAVAQRFDGSLLVLTPWRPVPAAIEATADPRVIHTVGRVEDVDAIRRIAARSENRPRVVLERLTSMRRHGLSARDLATSVRHARSGPSPLRVEGVALHLPLAHGSRQTSHMPEVERLLTDAVAAGLADPGVVWVSHLTLAELELLAARYPDLVFRPRVGTGLWLGDRKALRVGATVLDVHPVERGDVYGYRGRTAPRSGTLLVVSGGTAHGVGMAAPNGDPSLRSRAASLARGGLDAAGLARSPFTVGGKQRLFAEPPHMQVSMLFLPAGTQVPDIGSEVDVRVRFTTTTFDRVEIQD